MTKQGNIGFEAKPHHFLSSHDGDFAQLFRRWIVVDMGIHQKQLSIRQHQAIHTGINPDILRGARTTAWALTDDLINVLQMQGRVAPGTANHAVYITFVKQHRTNQRQAATHFDFGHLHRHALTLGHSMVGLPKITVATVLFDIHNVIIQLLLEPQAEFFNALRNDGGPANQGRAGKSLVHHNLAGAQDALFFALGVGHPFVACVFSRRENRLHGRARRIDKSL